MDCSSPERCVSFSVDPVPDAREFARLPLMAVRPTADAALSSCRSFLMSIANQRETFLETTGDVRYAGIPADVMRKKYPGEVVYNQEGACPCSPPSFPVGLVPEPDPSLPNSQTTSTFLLSPSVRLSTLLSRPRRPASDSLAPLPPSSESRYSRRRSRCLTLATLRIRSWAISSFEEFLEERGSESRLLR